MKDLCTIAGSLILFHYEAIIEQQAECPLLLCFSPSCGTGTTLELIITTFVYWHKLFYR